MGWQQVITPNTNDATLYVYSGGKALTDWYGMCLAVMRSAFGLPPHGATAWDCYSNYNQVNHEDRNWPRNVWFPIWFSGYGGAGHTCLMYIDDNSAITIKTSPYTHKAYFDTYTDVDRLARGYGVTYVGWSEDVAGERVIQWVDPPPPPQAAPAPEPTPPEVPSEPTPDPVPEPEAPPAVPTVPSVPEPTVPQVPSTPADPVVGPKPIAKQHWWVRWLIKLFPAIFHKS